MLLQTGRSHKYEIIPFPSRVNIKWLNLVLNLNGILCVCQDKRLMSKGQAYMDGSRPHSSTISYLIGTKAVFIIKGSLENLAMWQISLSRIQ
jgi:hypothetical protein